VLAFLHSDAARLIAVYIVAICEALLLFSLLDTDPRS
jgi:hypothetical protein